MEELKKQILEFLEEGFIPHKGLMALADGVAKQLKHDVKDVHNALRELENSGEIFEYNRNKFAPISLLNIKKGKLAASGYGYAFLCVEGGDDLYIAKNNLAGALDGDVVLVKVITNAVENKKGEGKVVKILQNANDEIVGTYFFDRSAGKVVPDNIKINKEIYISNSNSMNANSGDKVVVKVFDFTKRTLAGKVVEIIGEQGKKGTDIRSILRTFKVKEEFPADVTEFAKTVPQKISENSKKNRKDFTELVTFTIDGADAKDFDDAVSLEMNKDGTYRLGVHIADVGHYVTYDNVLDKEAFNRATSIYYLDQVIPMLPLELSNGICSLNPEVERLTLSVIMDIDEKGNIIGHEICESFIKSHYRMTYDEVTQIFNNDKKTCEKYKDIVPTILNMKKLSNILEEERHARGAINFEIPECVIEVDENGKPINIGCRKYEQSHKLIETFMVVANEVVAQKFCEMELPFVYRVHEKPNIEKITSFVGFLESLGVKTNIDIENILPIDLQKIIEKVEKESYAKVVNMIMLRSLKKAKYLPDCLGHFGLASTFYCHFTSPIRRYPDLVIHRIIKRYLRGEKLQNDPELLNFVEKASMQSSEREKLSEELERAVEDYKKCEYMQQFIGDEFEGTISSVLGRGLFVGLESTCEGYCSFDSMPQDYYELDEKTLTLVGQNHMFRIGDRVKIQVVACNLSEKKISFKLLEKLNKK